MKRWLEILINRDFIDIIGYVDDVCNIWDEVNLSGDYIKYVFFIR